MKLPLGFGTVEFEDWFRGLVAAVVSGGASAVTSGVIVSANDPKDYAMGTWNFFNLVISVFLCSALFSLMLYLAKKPLPDRRMIETTTQKIETDGPTPNKTVTTTKETVIEAIPPSGGNK